jgi:hypothetical protein
MRYYGFVNSLGRCVLMRNQIPPLIGALALLVVGGPSAWGASPQAPCDGSLTQALPDRPAAALGGHAFAQSIRGLSEDEREMRIREELLAGNIPQFLRHLVPIRFHPPAGQAAPIDIVICAAPDYLAIGSDEDFMLMPMRLATALSLASETGFTLPTPRIVDAIYAQATVHVAPQPLPASSEMRSTDYSVRHDELVRAQRVAQDTALGALTAGDKKDLVLTNRLWSHLDRVAIYGWHMLDGKPIQSLSTLHGWRYADYSHGARLISTRVFVDGKPRSIFEVMQDSRLAAALSGEGPLANAGVLIETLKAQAQNALSAALSEPLRP